MPFVSSPISLQLISCSLPAFAFQDSLVIDLHRQNPNQSSQLIDTDLPQATQLQRLSLADSPRLHMSLRKAPQARHPSLTCYSSQSQKFPFVLQLFQSCCELQMFSVHNLDQSLQTSSSELLRQRRLSKLLLHHHRLLITPYVRPLLSRQFILHPSAQPSHLQSLQYSGNILYPKKSSLRVAPSQGSNHLQSSYPDG
eukprot:TRINITY_DN8676_c0_g1_i1.p1 TRINITY_DN8676_c0_g1~~TRINITY_DN8676_c0_g1_i1.p1  ORF type:complete len:197 (+),score=-45.03 TRINITY_DN8676_c0_g1_i1:370-960(+)